MRELEMNFVLEVDDLKAEEETCAEAQQRHDTSWPVLVAKRMTDSIWEFIVDVIRDWRRKWGVMSYRITHSSET